MPTNPISLDYPLDRDGATWSWDETRMAFMLYLMLEPRQIAPTNPDIQQLAKALHRKPGAVSKKLWNIQAHDSNRVLAGKAGLSHTNKFDKLIWDEYLTKGEAFVDESMDLLTKTTQGVEISPGERVEYEVLAIPEGLERESTVPTRVNQQYFRNTLLTNYQHRCCLTGLAIEPLLVASHIKPWSASDPRTERLLASNGLLLNAFHDKAFDQGLITFDDDLRLIVSRRVKHGPVSDAWLFAFRGQRIERPLVMPPAREFLEYHRDVVFKG